MMGLVCGFVTMCLGFPFIATLLEPTPKALLSDGLSDGGEFLSRSLELGIVEVPGFASDQYG